MDEPRRRVAALLLAVLGVLAVAVLLVSQQWGVGLSPDSAVYIEGARNLAAGRGYLRQAGFDLAFPITHYPPLFSSALALMTLGGLDPLRGALWLNSLLFGLNASLLGLLVLRHTEGSLPTASLASVLFLTSLPVLQVHTMAWSEPLFMSFLLLAVFWLFAYLDAPRPWPLMAAAIALALAFLTRYAGVSFVGLAFLGVLLLPRASLKVRIRDAILLGVVAGGTVLWTFASAASGGRVANRALEFHPISAGPLIHLRRAIASYLWPVDTSLAVGCVRGAAVVVVLGMLVRSLVSGRREGDRRQLGHSDAAARRTSLLAGMAVGYLVFLVLTISFFDLAVKLDGRTLTPAFVLGLILLLSLMRDQLRSSPRSRALELMLTLVVLLFVATGLPAWHARLRAIHEFGQGYSGPVWGSSRATDYVRNLETSPIIYSNRHDVLYLLADRHALNIPRRKKHLSRAPVENELYRAQIETMRSRLRAGEGGLLVYYRLRGRRFQASEEELLEELRPVRIIAVDRVGAVYHVLPANSGSR